MSEHIARSLRSLDIDTLEMLCCGESMDLVLGPKRRQFLDTFDVFDLTWDDDGAHLPESRSRLRGYWEDPDRDVGLDEDGCPEVDLEGLDEPRIVKMLYWHQLPEHVQRRYAGKSQMGRLYVLENRLGEREYRWAECGVFEECWVYSRELTTRRDCDALQLLVS